MWNPEVTVTLNGVDYSADTLASVSITYGRSDITQSIRAGYANVSILSDENGIIYSAALLDINAPIVITMATSTGTETIFTGTVSDYTVQVLSPTLVQYSIIGVSPLAKIARQEIGSDGYPAEFQGQRIRRILHYGSGGKTWGQSTIQWQNANYAWNFGSGFDGTFANGFDFGVETSETANAFQSLLKAAQFGFLFENTNGTIDFYDFYSRTGTSDYTTILGEDTIQDNLSAQLTSAQVANDVTVTAFDGTIYQKSDQTSQNKYGLQEVSFDTWQSNAAQLNTVVNNYLDDWKNARLFVSGFTFPLSLLPTATRDTLIGIQGNDRLLIGEVLPAFSNERLVGPMGTIFFYRGIVEGWTWNIIKGEAFLSVNLSDWELNQVFV